MIYDRLGQRIVPGSLMVNIESGALHVALQVWRELDGIKVSQRRIEAGVWMPLHLSPLPLLGSVRERLRMVEVIRYVESF